MTALRTFASGMINVLLFALVAAVFVPLWCLDAAHTVAACAWRQLTHGND